MKIVRLSDMTTVNKIPKCVLALGIFDGVHVGHAVIISKAVEIAEKANIESAVWTFSPKPFSSFSSEITSISEKLELFKNLGVKFAVLENYENVRKLSPSEFVEKNLAGNCNCETAVCGYNFTFGYCAEGNSETLKELMSSVGRKTVIVDKITLADGSEVSSTEVRRAVEEGRMERASEILGRWFSHTSVIVSGKKVGRKFGKPTINQTFSETSLVPRRGVYVTLTKFVGDDLLYPSVTNVGVCPTFSDGDRKESTTCETHIISFAGESYGKVATVHFLKFIRDEKRFECVEELKKAIVNDEKTSVEYLTKLGI